MTREEAINEIKSWDFLEGKEIEAIHTLIPELRESDDERIMKDIVAAVEMHGDLTQGRKSEIYAYLEKQKDAFENGRQFGIMQEQARQELEWPDEKQKERKPAEWSEEDEEMWMDIKSHMIYGSFIPFDKIEWLEKRLKSLRPQPKPSWSEEDEKIMQTMIKEGDLKPSEIAWLKSLRSQPKQEWSEEDEAYRNFILESLEDQIRFCKKNAEGAYYAKQIRAAQNWLKSRCPSCKSSNQDELMRLKYAGTSTKLD